MLWQSKEYKKNRPNAKQRERKSYLMMVPKLKRTCLSAESALNGEPNVEEVPLGAKLPVIPGNKLLLYTVKLGERLHRTSCDFDRTYPRSDVYISNEYHCLHDSHLCHYFLKGKNMIKKLISCGLLTTDNKVVCSLKEYNLYRQYLKHLSIQRWNMIYCENKEKERVEKEKLRLSNIEKRRNDPDNPITLRLNQARKQRAKMAKSQSIRSKAILQLAKDDQQNRTAKQKEIMLGKIEAEIEREKRREMLKKVAQNQQNKECLVRKELLFRQHEEDMHRRQKMEERKKLVVESKHRKLLEKYENKKRCHELKIAELKAILEEEKQNRKRNIKLWEDRFARTLKQQQQRLKKIMVKQHEKHKNKHKQMKKGMRVWTDGMNSYPTYTKHKTGIFLQNQLSILGFHDAVVPNDLLDRLWQDEQNSFASQGDATGSWVATPSKHAQLACEDIILTGRSFCLIDDLISLTHNIEVVANNIVNNVIQNSSMLLLPLLQVFELQTKTVVPDTKIASLLCDLHLGIFDGVCNEIVSMLNLNSTEIADLRQQFYKTNDKVHVNDTMSSIAADMVDKIIGFTNEKFFTGNHTNAAGVSSITTADFEKSSTSIAQAISSLAEDIVHDVFSAFSNATELDSEESYKRVQLKDLSNTSTFAVNFIKSTLKILEDDFRICSRTEVFDCLAFIIKEISEKVVNDIIQAQQSQHSTSSMDTDASDISVTLNLKISELAAQLVGCLFKDKKYPIYGSTLCEEKMTILIVRIFKALIDIDRLLHNLGNRHKSKVNYKQCENETTGQFCKELINLNAFFKFPQRNLDNMSDEDVTRISRNLARKILHQEDVQTSHSSGNSMSASVEGGLCQSSNDIFSFQKSSDVLSSIKEQNETNFENTLRSLIAQETTRSPDDPKPVTSSTSFQVVNDALDSLAGQITEKSLGEAINSGSELESVVNAAVSQFVVNSLTQQILKRIQSTSDTSQTNIQVLNDNISSIVKKVIDFQSLDGSTTGNEITTSDLESLLSYTSTTKKLKGLVELSALNVVTSLLDLDLFPKGQTKQSPNSEDFRSPRKIRN
ncbi:uncharacterized protein LOC143450476 isoform X2 [Clavelina lepadiformis]|uniref:uncharacterized protein LOC143450476 isoform X2 n=1 Tax=Clavelina lepadiformis TaxID=159417 RepID=UPI00404169AB